MPAKTLAERTEQMTMKEPVMRRWLCSDSHHSQVVEAVSAPLAFEQSWKVPPATVRVATDLDYADPVEVASLDACSDWVTLTFEPTNPAVSPLVLEVRQLDEPEPEPSDVELDAFGQGYEDRRARRWPASRSGMTAAEQGAYNTGWETAGDDHPLNP